MHRLKDSELFSVHHCHTAKEVWQALRKKYEETYVGGKIYGIVGDMMSRRYVEGPDTSMMEHTCAFLADNARLADMKHDVGDTVLAMMILNSVLFAPEERWTFVEPLLNSFEEGKLEPNLVISRLVQREQTMKALASMRKQARKNRADRLGQ
ncbi:hypothetical protein A0H81_03740 [Grifola frondosa]|uniref:Uncharacterized protein n=1 Tax=Grifola frondosa TaxID=5627 RepID=A0A1C7MI18_GRIFR|nr:hypothetical protein A0H81_03740 [Grifola frondosa]